MALFHFPLAGPIGENAFVRGSFLFVDFFFVLSGFVIAHACTEKVGTGQGLAKFLVTRFGRLFPLHVFMLAAFVGFELVRWARSVSSPAASRHSPARFHLIRSRPISPCCTDSAFMII